MSQEEGYVSKNQRTLALENPGETLNNSRSPITTATKVAVENFSNPAEMLSEFAFDAFSTSRLMPDAQQPEGRIVSQPVEIYKSQIINDPSINFFSTEDEDENADATIRYYKCYVRLDNLADCLPLPSVFKENLKLPGVFTEFSPNPNISDAKKQSMYPSFILKHHEETDLKIGDKIKIQFLDSTRSVGRVLEVVESNELAGYDIGNVQVGDLQETAPEKFEELSRPISTIYKEDKGPISQEARNPEDINQYNFMPGPQIEVGKIDEEKPSFIIERESGGNYVKTRLLGFTYGVSGNPIIVAEYIVPSLMAMIKEALESVGGESAFLSSAIEFRNRVVSSYRFSWDSERTELKNALLRNFNDGGVTDSGQSLIYKDWYGNPIQKNSIEGQTPQSQERLRKGYCGPTRFGASKSTDILYDKSAEIDDLRGNGKNSKGDTKPCNSAVSIPRNISRQNFNAARHQTGTSIDWKTHNEKTSTWKGSRPDKMTKYYRWLSLNAWRFGFIRTVKSERWHWSYMPGEGMFSKVPRNNPLWDGQFDNPQYIEEQPEPEEVRPVRVEVPINATEATGE